MDENDVEYDLLFPKRNKSNSFSIIVSLNIYSFPFLVFHCVPALALECQLVF